MFTVSRFRELLKLFPRAVFDRAVQEHQADRYCKRMSSWQQAVAMIYAQLTQASSLRVLERGFNANAAHHYHLGCGPMRRSTLSDMNARGSVEVFDKVASALMQQARGSLREETQELLRLLDSSSLTLKGRGFDEWTKANRTRHTQGLKLHMLLGSGIPLANSISAANVNDIEYARTLAIEPGVVYVFDKGYCSYTWWSKIERSGARFVTRFKINASLKPVHQRKIPKCAEQIILEDAIVRFANKHPRGGHTNPYTRPLRCIKVARQKKAPLVLATNDLKSSALKIAERYRQRWQIELFFKWIKQHLRIKRFLGRSERAARIQILTALIAYLLVALYAKAKQLKQSLWMVLSELRATLFQRSDLERLRHQRWREQREHFQSVQQGLFA